MVKGDGLYGDGEFFHFDYYNSFVIHPMLLDCLGVMRQMDQQFEPVYQTALRRARRYAEIQERLIAPDATFPCIGRSVTYRFGALHALAQISLLHELPDGVKPAQVRCAMTAVIRKMMEASGTFDKDGWLTIGFCGHQASLAETTFRLAAFIFATALLPLGLPPADPFWSAPAQPWTSQRIWSGEIPCPGPRDLGIGMNVPALNQSVLIQNSRPVVHSGGFLIGQLRRGDEIRD